MTDIPYYLVIFMFPLILGLLSETFNEIKAVKRQLDLKELEKYEREE